MFKNGSFKNKLLPGCSVYCLVSLCVELDHVCFLRNTRRNDSEGMCLFADKQPKFRNFCFSDGLLFMLHFPLFF